MREIKFRAWDKSENQMSYSDTEFFDDMIAFRFKHWGIDIDTIDDIELMQFTGLKDRNGKEIYEGDIIGNPNYDLMKPKKIVFFSGSFGFWDKENSIPEFFMLYRYLTTRYVIGNVFENPELLK